MTWKKLYSARLSRVFFARVLCALLVVTALYAETTLWPRAQRVEQVGDVAVVTTPSIPSLLSTKDRELYQDIFRAQKTANWALADSHISELSSNLLLGQVLAERYLNRRFDAKADELVDWLNAYSDYPQAADIYELAVHKNPALKNSLEPVEKQTRLKGYGDGTLDEMRFDDETAARKNWQDGLRAWRSGDKTEAAKQFSALVKKSKDLSDWQYAAANFWAYRAYLATGDDATAHDYLKEAAIDAHSFYGILARKQLNEPLALDTKEEPLNAAELAEALSTPAIRRAIGMAQAGLTERAETQLRYVFTQASRDGKWTLLKIASALNLASVQISIAKQLGNEDRPLDFAQYPVPHWQPTAGFSVDPALLYALIRQESGFRASAIGPGGSLGLMQLMPKTASMMREDSMLGSASEPVMNMTLGERYVAHLLNNELVDGNLFYMLAAYNAGPARLKEWREAITDHDDPLLFVESIPYSVTRHYVMQVMTNYWIYSELAGTSNSSTYALLKGKWPIYRVASAE